MYTFVLLYNILQYKHICIYMLHKYMLCSSGYHVFINYYTIIVDVRRTKVNDIMATCVSFNNDTVYKYYTRMCHM